MTGGGVGRELRRTRILALTAALATVAVLTGAAAVQASPHAAGRRPTDRGHTGATQTEPLDVRVDSASPSIGRGEAVRLVVRWSGGSGLGRAVLGVDGLPRHGIDVVGPDRRGAVGSAGALASTFTLRTSHDLPAGRYLLGVRITVGRRSGSAPLVLTVLDRRRPFTITGDLVGLLTPGTAIPLDLRITNSSDQTLRLTRLDVAVTGVDGAHRGCPVVPNFAVIPFSGDTRRLQVPPRSSRSLSDLVRRSAWPRVVMVETGRNQDGCKGAHLTLTYTAAAEGMERRDRDR